MASTVATTIAAVAFTIASTSLAVAWGLPGPIGAVGCPATRLNVGWVARDRWIARDRWVAKFSWLFDLQR